MKRPMHPENHATSYPSNCFHHRIQGHSDVLLWVKLVMLGESKAFNQHHQTVYAFLPGRKNRPASSMAESGTKPTISPHTTQCHGRSEALACLEGHMEGAHRRIKEVHRYLRYPEFFKRYAHTLNLWQHAADTNPRTVFGFEKSTTAPNNGSIIFETLASLSNIDIVGHKDRSAPGNATGPCHR